MNIKLFEEFNTSETILRIINQKVDIADMEEQIDDISPTCNIDGILIKAMISNRMDILSCFKEKGLLTEKYKNILKQYANHLLFGETRTSMLEYLNSL